MKIRLATPEDIPHIMRIEQASSTAAHWSEQRYRDLFNEFGPHRLTLLLEDQEITAFIVAAAMTADWEIENIVVEPQTRRRGQGRALVRELLARARKELANSVLLEVRESNVPARQLYLSLGFKQINQRPRYYSHPEEDAIVYRFEIV